MVAAWKSEISTEDIHEWRSIDVKWVGNLQETETYGFVAVEARYAESDVPAVIEALVRRGPHKLRQEDRNNFIRMSPTTEVHGPPPPIGFGGGLPAEMFFVQRHMEGHSREDEYIKRLEKWHAAERKKRCRPPKNPEDNHSDAGSSSMSSNEKDELNNALTFVALDNMDEGNRAEWIKEKKMKSLSGL